MMIQQTEIRIWSNSIMFHCAISLTNKFPYKLNGTIFSECAFVYVHVRPAILIYEHFISTFNIQNTTTKHHLEFSFSIWFALFIKQKSTKLKKKIKTFVLNFANKKKIKKRNFVGNFSFLDLIKTIRNEEATFFFAISWFCKCGVVFFSHSKWNWRCWWWWWHIQIYCQWIIFYCCYYFKCCVSN